MLSSSKFVVALHILTVLAHRRGHGPVSSKMIADSVGTNPVVIRRLMTALEGAALVNATAGRHGGFELAREPRQIRSPASTARSRARTCSSSMSRRSTAAARSGDASRRRSPGRLKAPGRA